MHMTTKYCPKCDDDIDISLFGKDKSKKDGLCSQCKSCTNAYNKAWNARNPEKRAQYDKTAARVYVPMAQRTEDQQRRLRASKRRWVAANPDKIKGYQDSRVRIPYSQLTDQQKRVLDEDRKRWVERNPEKERARLRAQKLKFPEKTAARKAVEMAVRNGSLIREPCVVCSAKLAHAHHEYGYERENWLKVVWLCQPHHTMRHLELKNSEVAEQALRV